MSVRTERMGDVVRDLIATSLMGGEMGDPRLQAITITAVKMSGDLQVASVFFRVFEDKNIDASLAGLSRAKGFFRSKLAKALDVRRAPELRFFYDKSIENGSRIEALLREIKQ